MSSVNDASQTVTAGSAVNFATDRAVNGTSIQHTAGTGIFTLMGPGVYLVAVNAAVSLPTVTTPTSVSLALSANGAVIPGVVATSSVTSSGQTVPLSVTSVVTVPSGTMTNLSVTNSGTSTQTVAHANITIVRVG